MISVLFKTLNLFWGKKFENSDFLKKQVSSLLKIHEFAKSGKKEFFIIGIIQFELKPFETPNEGKEKEYLIINEMKLKYWKASFLIGDPLFRIGYDQHMIGDHGDKRVLDSLKEYDKHGLKHADARHIAIAIASNYEHFVTTDRKLIELWKKTGDKIIKVIPPVDLLSLYSKNDNYKND